jgi:hypothetical protein
MRQRTINRDDQIPDRLRDSYPGTFPAHPSRRLMPPHIPFEIREVDFGVAADALGMHGYTAEASNDQIVLDMLDRFQRSVILRGVSPRGGAIKQPSPGQPVFLLGDHAPVDPQALESRGNAFGNWMAEMLKNSAATIHGHLSTAEASGRATFSHLSIQEAIVDAAAFLSAGFRRPESQIGTLNAPETPIFPTDQIQGLTEVIFTAQSPSDQKFIFDAGIGLGHALLDHEVPPIPEYSSLRRDTAPTRPNGPKLPSFFTHGFSCSPLQDGKYSIRVFGASPYL